MPIGVVLADDHALVRQGLRAVLEQDGFAILGEACNGEEAIRLVERVQPEIAILDVGMPVMNGLEATRELQKVAPHTKVIVLTRHEEDQYVIEALRAGVRGYVLKSQAAKDLVQAVQQVRAGRVYLSPGVTHAVVDAYLSGKELPSDSLTARERQVLQLVSEGKSTKEIANLLGISVKTAESHRGSLMRKLDIHETASLVRYAIRRGLVQP